MRGKPWTYYGRPQPADAGVRPIAGTSGRHLKCGCSEEHQVMSDGSERTVIEPCKQHDVERRIDGCKGCLDVFEKAMVHTGMGIDHMLKCADCGFAIEVKKVTD